jgi:hypothetical protein
MNEQTNGQGSRQQQRDGPLKNGSGSPKKAANKPVPAPNRDDLGEFPSFSNGLSLTADDPTSQVQSTTTVNPVPVMWGPTKRNK